MTSRSSSPSAVVEIDPAQAHAALRAGAVLIDTRGTASQQAGSAEGALRIPHADVPERIAGVADKEQPVMLMCAAGVTSRELAQTLTDLGYRRVSSVRGGFARWCAEQLPLRDAALGADAMDRYSRQIILPQVGAAGQQRLSQARVALLGAGGLGAPISLYLAAAGVGQLTLIDDDHVERSNLQRQVIHTEERIGTAKVDSARVALQALNPALKLETHRVRLRADNVEQLLQGHDLIIDGTDNFATRYLLDAAARRLGVPFIYGAVFQFSGQVSVFDPRREDSPCYRCLFPEPPAAEDAPNCAEAGVLGVLPGTIGMLQATEALKLVLDVGSPLVGRLLCYDALAARFSELKLPRDPQCPGCGPDHHFDGYHDIVEICAAP